MRNVMVLMVLGMSMVAAGCNCPAKNDDTSAEPKKMSVEGKSGSCPASCDKSKAK